MKNTERSLSKMLIIPMFSLLLPHNSCGEFLRFAPESRVCLLRFPAILFLAVGTPSYILRELYTGSTERR